MEDDTPILLLIVVLGGAAVWYIMSRKTTPAAIPVAAPCVVGGSYMGTGLSLPCSVVSGAVVKVEEAVKLFPAAFTNPFSSDTDTTSAGFLGRIANDANKLGVIAQRPKPGALFGGPLPSDPKLPPGAVNMVNTRVDARPELDVVQISQVAGAPPAVLQRSL